MCQHIRADFGVAAAFCKFICHPIRACQSINLLSFGVRSLLSPFSFQKIDDVVKKRLDRIGPTKVVRCLRAKIGNGGEEPSHARRGGVNHNPFFFPSHGKVRYEMGGIKEIFAQRQS